MNKILSITSLLISSIFAVQATAGNHTDYAQVVDVKPIFENIEHRVPQRECWTETVAYKQPHKPQSATGTIVGTLVGAAIGNQIGRDKRGRKIGRVAGAVLGASIGHDASRASHYANSPTRYQDQQRCETRYSSHYEEQVVGYNVTYRYHGNIYHTRTNQHPGNKLKVAVHVRPIY